MKKLTFIMALLLFGQIIQANTTEAWVQGRVTDQQTRETIPGVNVLFKKNQGTVTNSQGVFLIQAEEGPLVLSFRMLGYKTLTRNVQLKAKDTLRLNISLEQDIIEIDQVVVTANRIEQRMAELTVSMSVIKPDEINAKHITDAKELIDKAPGIEVLDGQASIRGGSGFSYGAGSRVMALVDGLPIVASDAGNIRWQFLPLENISQVEIIKGASSVAYGSSALNGVINFRTADATVIPVTKAWTEAGIYDKPKNKNWVWWNTPRIFGSIGFNHLRKISSTDIGFGINVTSDNGYRKLNENNIARLNLKIKHFSKKHQGLAYGMALNGGFNGKTDFVLWENAETGALKQDTSTAIKLRSSFFAFDPFITFIKSDKLRHELRARIQRSSNVFPDSEQNDSEALSLYTEYQLRYTFNDLITLSAGLSQNSARIISNFYGDHNSLNLGGFTQVELQPAERLKFVAGLRIEHNVLDGEKDNLTPLIRSGLNYKLFDYTYLRASFGQGYRYPSIAERHAATTLGAVKIFPNYFIKAESGWNAEVGIRQGLKTEYFTGQIDLAIFYLQNNDLIEYIFGIYRNPGAQTFSFGFRADNIEASRVYGLELEWMLSNRFGAVVNTLNGGYVFMHPVEFNPFTGKNTDLMLKYRRKHSVKLNWNSNYKKIDAGFSINVRSKILRIDDVFLNELTREGLLPGFYDYWQTGNKGHVLVDLQLGYNISEKLNLSFVAKNLLNEEYIGRPGDIQPQRNFSIRLSGKF
jgi:outer membrane receptor protein involved in Fe transport